MERVKTVRELIKALKKLDQNAVVLVSPWAGSTNETPVNDIVCVDYVNEDLWPVKGVLISN
jgi:hypothetical protein